jgi:5-formyltetrahydrofolate cyclo-ligase
VPDPARSQQESEKRALRAQIRERRRIRTSTERANAAAAITQHLVDLASGLQVRSLSAYLSLPDEPGTRDFVAWACGEDIRVLLPVSREDGLLDWAPYDGPDEELDILGLPAPTSDLLGPIAINDVDLIIVPAAAVDRSGMRMGWGRGYFDKTLGSMEACPPVYAVIFDDELVEAVPRERHDMPVSGVVTPSGITTFAR